MRGLVGLCAAALVTMSAGSAGAVDYLFENFNSEDPQPPGSEFETNYNHFANFFVYDGTVDLVSAGEFGITSGDGFFVDTDGSRNDGGVIETIRTFDFAAGDRIRLSLDVSGNQRGATFGLDDNLFAGFRFFTGASYSNVQLTGFSSVQTPAPLLLGVAPLVAFNQPFTRYSISFTADSAGTIGALIGTGSDDNVGPLIDNVRIGTFVPEPSSWAMMILGFAGIGAALRSRRRAAAVLAR